MDINPKALTQTIDTRPVVKVIGNKTYIVESFFNEEADCNLTDKIKNLFTRDMESLTKTLLPGGSELTSHNPDRSQPQF